MPLNLNVLTTPSGYLKILQVVLGSVCLGIVANHFTMPYGSVSKPVLIVLREAIFFLIVTSACLFTSVLLLLSFLHGNTAEKINKTTFYILYHICSSVFYLSAVITFATVVVEIPPEARDRNPYKYAVIALICGAVNSIFYAAGAYVGCKADVWVTKNLLEFHGSG